LLGTAKLNDLDPLRWLARVRERLRLDKALLVRALH
jgi:hypothetical protein